MRLRFRFRCNAEMIRRISILRSQRQTHRIQPRAQPAPNFEEIKCLLDYSISCSVCSGVHWARISTENENNKLKID